MQRQDRSHQKDQTVRYGRSDGTRSRKARSRALMLRRQRALKLAEAR